jgi:hypothetical protein
MKKNTLLYLDNGLVMKAKKAGLNLSKISEQAIELQLWCDKEDKKTTFEEIIELLRGDNQIYFIPVEIKNIKISNLLNFSNFKANFKKVNYVIGENASGKTNLLKLIVQVFTKSTLDKEHLLLDREKEGKIKLSFNKSLHGLDFKIRKKKDTAIDFDYPCILIDNTSTTLNQKEVEKIINYLIDKKCQIIATGKELPKFKIKDLNVIALPK